MVGKRLQCGLFAALLVLGQTGLVTAQTSPSFSDVGTDDPHFAAAEFLKSKEIISGYKDGSFKPDQTINRAEAVKILMLARDYLKAGDVTLQKISFPDVKSSDWFYPYVQKAFSLKIVEGYDDGTFKPANEINRAESLKVIILSLIPDYSPMTVSSNPFIDAKSTDWFAQYALYAKTKQIVDPDSSGKLNPADSITRGDFIETIYRLIYIKENNLDKFPLSQNWPSCKDTTNGYTLKTPFNWTQIQAGNDLILWHQDSAGGQVSFARVYPNSAVIIVARDPNPKNYTLTQYLKLIDYGSGASVVSQPLNGLDYSTIYLKDSGIQDSYFKLSDNSILILYGQVGSGALSDNLTAEMRYVINSVKQYDQTKDSNLPNCASPAPATPDLLTQFRTNILVAGKGKAAIDSLGDMQIISTDTIGIGTGPIDYYYSATYNLTVKYERNSDTILAEQDSKTTSF